MPRLPQSIVILSDFANVAGGAEYVALSSARALADRGVCVTVLAGTGPVDASLAEHPDIQVHVLGQSPFFKSANKLAAAKRVMWNVAAAAEMARVLGGLDPRTTVVHAHSYLKLLSAAVLDVALSSGFRTVLTLHEYGIACPQQSFFDNVRGDVCTRRALSAACCTSQCTAHNAIVKAGLVLRASLQRRARIRERLSAFIAPSALSHSVLRPYLPEATPVFALQNPVEVHQGPRVRCRDNSSATYIGRLTPEKAPEHLARAARRTGTSAVFVGEGIQRATVLEALPEATITGWLETAAVRERLIAARAVVCPSIWYEVGPLGLYDAMAYGIPVVASDRCGAAELLEDGATGLIYPAGDVDALAHALERLKDHALVDSLGQAAYESFWSVPRDLSAHADALLGVYSQVLAGPK